MLFAILVGAVVVLGVPVVAVLALRRWGLQELGVEERLRAPQAHKVSFVVPAGQDPVVVRAALARAGLVTVVDVGTSERILVECEDADRERVRQVIEEVERTRFTDVASAEPVRFEEDRD